MAKDGSSYSLSTKGFLMGVRLNNTFAFPVGWASFSCWSYKTATVLPLDLLSLQFNYLWNTFDVIHDFKIVNQNFSQQLLLC